MAPFPRIRSASPSAVSLGLSARAALAGGLLCWAGFAMLAALTLTGHFAPFDEAGLRYWRTSDGTAGANMLPWVHALTLLGGVPVRGALDIAIVALLAFLQRRREAWWLALTVVGGWVANSALKLAVGRTRPDVVPHLVDAGGASFPSGHSFNSAALYIAIALVLGAASGRRWTPWLLLAGAVALSLAIAWSRVWLGVHFPGDVAAGWLGGAGWTLLAWAWLRRDEFSPARFPVSARNPGQAEE